MMDEYPNPDEEFELMYADEFDALKEIEGSYNSSAFPSSKNDLNNTQINGRVESVQQNDVSSVENSQTTIIENQNVANKKTTSNVDIVTSPIDIPIESDTPDSDVQLIEPATTVPKKRSIQELFGDIDDILSEEIIGGRVIKRKKDIYTDDLALIDHIVQLRRLNKERQNHVEILSKSSFEASHDRNICNISYTLPKYSFVTITRNGGERLYMRCHSEQYEKEELKKIGKDTFKGVMGETFKDIWNEAKAEINRTLDHENCNTPMELDNSSASGSILNKPHVDDTTLWVDLYRPRRYVELLSDESTNRILLQWLKLWDKVVFKRKPKLKMMNAATEENFTLHTYFKKLELNTTLDEQGFPANKVALLCGPPGLGKTTLAHMIATHAGYNPVEVNASDDRTPEKFSEILKCATEMESVVHPNKRPNCVIFDEIDGAPSASINFLVKYISGDVTEKKKKGVKKACVLKRPIICICNDIYVPALKPLRQIAFVVNFPPTGSGRLAERLNEIAKDQKVEIDTGALQALCEKTDNDIRSCLSALHFFKSLSKRITYSQVSSTSIGQKDMQKALFTVWQSIFFIERPKMNQTLNGNDGSLKSRMRNILHTVNNFGDYEKLAQGIFENYSVLNNREISLKSACEALEWFCYSDIVNTEIHKLQNYTLSSYLAYCFVVWHFVFGSSSRSKLIYPSAGYEAKVKSTKNFAILTEVMKGMQPSVRAYTYSMALKLDILPILSTIIIPSLRPVNLYLFTNQEKEILQNAVNIMIDYNLTYDQERGSTGSYDFNIDPNINELILFSTSNRTRTLSYFNKQLIAREIEVEKMRRIELHKSKHEDHTNSRKDAVEKQTNQKETPKNVPNHLQRLKPKSVSPKGQGAATTKDFFGRIITKPTTTNKTGPDLKTDIWYQYKEGYSNAVRKRIKISSLE